MNNDSDSDAAKFDEQATAAAASVGALLEPYLARGGNPAILSFGMIAFAANLLAQATTPGDAAMTLQAVAAGLAP